MNRGVSGGVGPGALFVVKNVIKPVREIESGVVIALPLGFTLGQWEIPLTLRIGRQECVFSKGSSPCHLTYFG